MLKAGVHGQDSYNRPSRFLSEIPQELLSEVRMNVSTQGLFGSGYASPVGSFEEEATGMRMGQRVMHGKYGEGVVLQFEGSGERAKVEVNFAEGSVAHGWLCQSAGYGLRGLGNEHEHAAIAKAARALATRAKALGFAMGVFLGLAACAPVEESAATNT